MISQYLSNHDFQLLLRQAQLLHYRRGDIIVHPGGWSGKPIYIVKDGLVSMYGVASNTSQFVHMLYGKYELFPVTGLNVRPKDMSMPIGAKAETDVSVYAITRADLTGFLSGNATREQALLNQVVEQFKIYTYRVENLEYTRARERVAYRTLLFASRFGKLDNGVIVIPRISGKTVASAVCMSEEAVSREMARLKDMGIINYAPGKVLIHDTEKLRQQIGNNVQLPFQYPATSMHSVSSLTVTA